ncbi:MAG: MlaD family protein [Aeromicrobium sp.]|uniref:MCE family protein n=1 Tax=Aeromicrobium sp. TaxID=1871063 RepID=UPI0039E700EB
MSVTARLKEPRFVGLLGVIGLLLFALLVFGLSTAQFGKQRVTAVLEHTAGLRVGEEVQVAGVGVGEVTAIRLTDKAVEVDFTIDSDIDLGSTTTAAVKVATLLGTHYLEVTPSGTGSLKNDTIPIKNTSVPYNLQDVIDGADTALTEIDEKAVADAMTVVSDVLGQTPEEARAAIEGVANLSSVAVQRTDQLQSLLNASATFTGLLNSQSADIMTLLQQSSVVLQELNARQQAIDSLLVDAQALADAVNGILADTADDLDPLMANLSQSLDHLYQVRDSIMETVTSLSTMTVYLANATGNGPWVDLNVPSINPDNLAGILPTGEALP